MVTKKNTPGSTRLLECGSQGMKEQFGFDAAYRNLNHGSYGAYPKAIRDRLRQYQDEAEARPDPFIRYEYPEQLDASRKAIAKYLNVETDSCVFVQNATTGINTVLRNLVWNSGDVIIYFATTYGACAKTIEYITETTPAESRQVEYTYPVSDAFLCDAFEALVAAITREGKTPRLAIFDTIVSMPGVRMPFERLTALCRTHGVLSCIDGAHGVGHIPLDLAALDPDFFVSNCHKWLLVPRGCAVFYVPRRNQRLLRSTLPTSHGFVPRPRDGVVINNPMPPSAKSEFINNFEYVATVDNAPYVCVPAALEFRGAVSWEGQTSEAAVYGYCLQQASDAGHLVAKVLGTDVMENEEGTLGRCFFRNVRLPLDYQVVAGGDYTNAVNVAVWTAKTLVKEYDTFMAIFFHADSWWIRISAQIYLTMEDWEWAAKVLSEICTRVEKSEWKA